MSEPSVSRESIEQQAERLGRCEGCDLLQVPYAAWKTIPAEERKDWQARGYVASGAFGLCMRCYQWVRYREQHGVTFT